MQVLTNAAPTVTSQLMVVTTTGLPSPADLPVLGPFDSPVPILSSAVCYKNLLLMGLTQQTSAFIRFPNPDSLINTATRRKTAVAVAQSFVTSVAQSSDYVAKLREKLRRRVHPRRLKNTLKKLRVTDLTDSDVDPHVPWYLLDQTLAFSLGHSIHS